MLRKGVIPIPPARNTADFAGFLCRVKEPSMIPAHSGISRFSRGTDAVMTSAPNEDRQLAHTRTASVQTYARIAGILLLLSIVAGGFGEAYVPSRLIVSS